MKHLFLIASILCSLVFMSCDKDDFLTDESGQEYTYLSTESEIPDYVVEAFKAYKLNILSKKRDASNHELIKELELDNVRAFGKSGSTNVWVFSYRYKYLVTYPSPEYRDGQDTVEHKVLLYKNGDVDFLEP